MKFSINTLKNSKYGWEKCSNTSLISEKSSFERN